MPDTDPTSLHKQALQAYAAGNRPAAAALCRDLLNRDPPHAEAAFLLGAIAIDEGRPAEALVAFEHARSLRPGEARFLHAHGEACRSLGQLGEAAESLLAAVRIDPTLAAAHNTLGVMAFDAGDITGAIGRLSAGIAVRPDYPRLHLNLGRARQLGQDVDGAIACYREALRLDPRPRQLGGETTARRIQFAIG